MNQQPVPELTGEHGSYEAVMQQYCEIDRQTARFAAESGIRCSDGCGACCHSPHVEATAEELAPLAHAIIARGEAGRLLARIDAAHGSGDRRCVLFATDPQEDPMRGRCSEYPWRPAMCRLFGFAGQRGPDGDARFTACRQHTATMPEVVANARSAIAGGRLELPILADLASSVRAVAGGPGPLRPINEALAEAIAAAALRARLRAEESADSTDEDGEDRRPPARPRRPRLRRAA
jgi:Fe-S-cluster containining protein